MFKKIWFFSWEVLSPALPWEVKSDSIIFFTSSYSSKVSPATNSIISIIRPKTTKMSYSRTRIYRISEDCGIYPIYPKSDMYTSEFLLFCITGTEIFSRYIRLSDITEFYCIMICWESYLTQQMFFSQFYYLRKKRFIDYFDVSARIASVVAASTKCHHAAVIPLWNIGTTEASPVFIITIICCTISYWSPAQICPETTRPGGNRLYKCTFLAYSYFFESYWGIIILASDARVWRGFFAKRFLTF